MQIDLHFLGDLDLRPSSNVLDSHTLRLTNHMKIHCQIYQIFCDIDNGLMICANIMKILGDEKNAPHSGLCLHFWQKFN